MADQIGIKVLVDAAAAVANLKKTEDGAKAATEAFEKLSDAEKRAVVEMARLQATARAAAADEARLSAYVAESSRLRREETSALQQASRAAAEETRKFTAETDRLAREQEKLAVAIERTRDEIAKLKAANDDNASKLEDSRSIARMLTTDVGQLGERIKSISPYWGSMAVTAVGSFTRIAASVGVALASIGAVAVALGRAAGESDNQARAASLLGGAYERVRAATADTITAQQALALQQGLVQSGLNVTGEQLAALAARARTFALATGGDTSEALGQMLDAMRGLESEGLRRFGVTLNSTGDRQRDFNSAVEQATTAQSNAEAQSRKWGTALTGVAAAQQTLAQTMQGSQRTMTEEVDRTTRAFSQMTSGIASAVARALNLSEVFSFMASDVIPTLFDSAGSDARNQRNIDGSIMLRRSAERSEERGTARNALNALRANRQISTEQFDQYSSALNTRGATREDYIRIEEYARRAGRESAPVAQSMLNEVMRPLLDASQRQFEQEHRANQLRQDISDMEAAGNRKARRAATAGGSSGSGGNELRDAMRAYQEAIADSPDGATQIFPADMPQNPRETATAYYQRLAEIQRGFNSAGRVNDLDPVYSAGQSPEDQFTMGEKHRALLDAADEQREQRLARQQRIGRRDRETRTQALRQDRSVGGGILRGLGVTGDALETEAKLTQGYADTIIGAYSKIGDAITRHVELVASGQETIGQAMLNGVHEVTKTLAMEALPKSLMELAAGFAALANPITAPTAPLHFTAAAVYGSVAAGAGIVAGVTGALGAGQSAGAASGARATGSARAASGASPRPTQEAAAPVTIYLSSIVPPGPRELQGLVNATAQAGRYNLDRRRDMVPRAVRT